MLQPHDPPKRSSGKAGQLYTGAFLKINKTEIKPEQPRKQEQRRHEGFQHISKVLENLWHSNLPEYASYRQILRELLIWEECLKRCSPAFAKSFIMRLREREVIPDYGAEALIQRLKLEAA